MTERLWRWWRNPWVRAVVYAAAACLLAFLGGYKPPSFIYQQF